MKDDRIIYDRRLKAVLCESTRIDGKPRQQHIAFLGSIGESMLPSFFEGIPTDEANKMKFARWEERSLSRCHWFWEHTLKKLDKLDNRIPKEERQKIEASIARLIPRPTPAESVEVEKRAAEAMAGLRA